MLRFAIVGCGRVAGNHVAAIRGIEGATLVAVCDLDVSKARAVVGDETTPVYANYHEMLRSESIDVVNVVTPSGMHATHAIEIMSMYQKHVVVEKPMALRVEDAEAMIACAETHGVQLHVVHQNRFNRAVQKVREAMDGGRFGKPVLGTMRLRWCRPQRYYDQAPWRGTWGLDGGALTNQAIHHIDLLQWLMGEVVEVSATITTRLVSVEVEDTAAAWLRFASGAIGVVEATTAARPDDLEASVSIIGETGNAIVEGASVNRLVTWSFGDVDLASFSEAPPNVYGFGHTPFMETVVQSIAHGAPPAVSGHDGIAPVKILHAIYRSAELGTPVIVSERPFSERFGVITDALQPIYASYVSQPGRA